MGKALQVRVSAVTWNEQLVSSLWPQLSELAFSVPLKHNKQGVLEMVQSLGDGLQFMPWSAQRKQALRIGIEKAVDVARRIEGALAKWKPNEANKLSDELETVLDDLEKNFR